MADTTTNYGLTKPLQIEPYNVDVQNGNMDKIDVELKLLATQSSEKANDTDSNRTTTNKTVTGAINELKGSFDALGNYKKITTSLSSSVDLLTLNDGEYIVYNHPNMPVMGTATLSVRTQPSSTKGFTLKGIWGDIRDRLFFMSINNSTLGTWKEIATTESATLTLLNGWTEPSSLIPKVTISGKVATLNVRISGGTVAVGTDISTIPIGYRPISTIYIPAFNSVGTFVGNVYIDSYGLFRINLAFSSNANVIINASYYI